MNNKNEERVEFKDMEIKYSICYERKGCSKVFTNPTEFSELSGAFDMLQKIRNNPECNVIGFIKTYEKQEFIPIGDIKYVANIRLGGKGGVGRCIIFTTDDKVVNLQNYISNPMGIKDLGEIIHVQNLYSSIEIETKDITNITIGMVEEW